MNQKELAEAVSRLPKLKSTSKRKPIAIITEVDEDADDNQNPNKTHVVITGFHSPKEDENVKRTEKEQREREKKLRQIIYDKILRPKEASRTLLYHDLEVQFPELTVAYHLIKDNDQYSINVVAIPKWVEEMTEAYDDSKSDKYLLTLQEIEAGVFQFDGENHQFIESEGWGLHDYQRKAFKKKLTKMDLLELVDSITYENNSN